MKWWRLVTWLTIPLVLSAAENYIRADHALLSSIASPQELLFPLLPNAYTASVELSGSVAEEMERAVVSAGFSAPQYEETFDKKRSSLSIALVNEEFPTDTRDLVGGILNPSGMLDVVLRGLLKFKSPEAHKRLRSETSIWVDTITADDSKLLKVRLLPKGERFDYEYHDAGAMVRESWSTEMVLVLDQQRGLLRQLSSRRCSRMVYAGDRNRKAVDTSWYVYRVDYDSSWGAAIPASLRISVDHKVVLTLSASYRKVGEHVVFNSREIASLPESGDANRLIVTYRDYHLRTSTKQHRKAPKPRASRSVRTMSSAADLSRKASNQLRDGDVAGAVRTLTILQTEYPGTPQAIAAKELLSALPRK